MAHDEALTPREVLVDGETEGLQIGFLDKDRTRPFTTALLLLPLLFHGCRASVPRSTFSHPQHVEDLGETGRVTVDQPPPEFAFVSVGG